jgi:hypothetical protein
MKFHADLLVHSSIGLMNDASAVYEASSEPFKSWKYYAAFSGVPAGKTVS